MERRTRSKKDGRKITSDRSVEMRAEKRAELSHAHLRVCMCGVSAEIYMRVLTDGC